MKVTQEEVVDNQAVLNIELEEDDLDEYLERGYRSVVNRLRIPGFRKGKAPRRIVESLLGREGLLSEALDYMLPDATDRAVAAQELDITGVPSYDLTGFEPVSFTATVALRPEVDLGDYKALRLKSELKEVTSKDVDAEIERMRESMVIWEPVERESATGDMVTVNIQGTSGDRTLLDQQGTNIVLDPDRDDGRLPGLFDHLTGLKEDESTEFELELGEGFGDQELSGSSAKFEATITGVKQKVLPDLDDQFASSVGEGYDSVEALRDEIESGLRRVAEEVENRRRRNKAVETLVDSADVLLAPMLAEHRMEHLKRDRDQSLERMGMTLDNFLAIQGTTAEEMDGQMMDRATSELRSAFVIEKLAEAEEITVSEDEIEERLERMIASAGRKLTNRERRELNSAESRENLSHGIRNEKAVDRLLELVTIEPPDESSGGNDEEEAVPEGTEGQTND
jgi:trigger factor